MGEEKRYYWIKLPEDFYDEDTIQWIEEQENGPAYVNFYLKLLLKSLEGDGYLIRYVGKRLIPYDIKSLANLTRTEPDTVMVAMELFKQLGLVEILDSGEIYMSQINEMIGSETQAAKRMRRMRAKQKLALESSNDSNNVTQERNNVQKSYTDNRYKNIDIRDRDIDIRHNIEKNDVSNVDNSNESDVKEYYFTDIKANKDRSDESYIDKAIAKYGWQEVLWTMVKLKEDQGATINTFKYIQTALERNHDSYLNGKDSYDWWAVRRLDYIRQVNL